MKCLTMIICFICLGTLCAPDAPAGLPSVTAAKRAALSVSDGLQPLESTDACKPQNPSTSTAETALDETTAALAAEETLLRWLVQLGSQIRVEIRRSSSSLRGLHSAGEVAAGEVLVRVPLSAALSLGTAEDTAPELAVQLLRERYRSRPRYGPYFDVLPPPPLTDATAAASATYPYDRSAAGGAAVVTTASPAGCASCGGDCGVDDTMTVGEVQQAAAAGCGTAAAGAAAAAAAGRSGLWEPSCAEELPEEAVAALAGDDLRQLVERKQQWMRQVWTGDATSVRLPLARAVPRRDVSLAEFAWATCMVTSRSISGPGGALLLIPLIDLANHCASHWPQSGEEGPSAELRFKVQSGAVVLELVAARDLATGDEVCISYGDLRPDEALLYYGFLPSPSPPAPSATPCTASCPLPSPLFAVDEREYESAARPGKVSYKLLVAGSASAEVLREEVARLEALLSEMAAKAAAVAAAPRGGSCEAALPDDGLEGRPGHQDCYTCGETPLETSAGGGAAGVAVTSGGGGSFALVARLNAMRVDGLRAEIARLRGALSAEEQP